jgi:hypothetical protein
MNVKAIKLMSGEEIVGEILAENEDEITIKNPVAVMLSRTQTGDINVGFIPFAPYVGKHPEITFKVNNLIMVSEVDEQMKNQYNSVFGGIVTPPKQLLIG